MPTSNDEACLPQEADELTRGRRLFRAATGPKMIALVDQAVVSGTNFITSLVIGRVGGPDELGVYALGFTLVVFALSFQDSFVSSPYTIFGNRVGGEERSRLAGAALAQIGFLALLLSACLAAAAWFAGGALPQVPAVLGVLALTVPWLLLREFCRRLSYAHLHTRDALTLDASVSLLQLGGLFALAAFGALSAPAAHAVVGLACALVGCAALALNRRRFAFDRGRMVAEALRNWSFGRWVLAGQLTALGYWYLVPWLLAARLGTEATGAFVACLTIVTVANPFVLGFGIVVGPSAARAYADAGAARLRRVILQATLPLAAITLFISGFAALAGGPFIAFLYGPEYAGHGLTAALIGLLVPLVATSTMADHGLRAVGRPDVNFTASLASLLVTFVAAWALLGPYQLAGAAASLVAGEVVGFAVRWGAFWRLTQAVPEEAK